MNTISMNLDIPRDLVVALNVPQAEIADRIRELIAVSLFREGRISSGKGSELLGISKFTFIQLLAKHGIDYFTENAGELTSDVADIALLLQKASK